MQLHVSPDANELSTTYAQWLVNYIGEVLQQRDRFTIALSGGSTPKKLHELLATPPYRDAIDWSRMHVFWGDERFVPLSDERSNAKMAYDTLLNQVPIPAGQVHVMQTENITPEASAQAYEQLLHQYFNGQPFTFDLVILGMGDDGHTLSLFPGLPVVHETQRWVTSFWLEAQQMYRITLTRPVTNQAACVTFLATGDKKVHALKEVLQGQRNADLYPSQLIQPAKGQLHWFVDKAAAAGLE